MRLENIHFIVLEERCADCLDQYINWSEERSDISKRIKQMLKI
jgi:hypothetical protein